MAHKKGAGSTKNGRDSQGQRLGQKMLKKDVNCVCTEKGSILVRQRGLKRKPGRNVHVGSDYTLYSVRGGNAYFKKIKKTTFVNIYALD